MCHSILLHITSFLNLFVLFSLYVWITWVVTNIWWKCQVNSTFRNLLRKMVACSIFILPAVNAASVSRGVFYIHKNILPTPNFWTIMCTKKNKTLKSICIQSLTTVLSNKHLVHHKPSCCTCSVLAVTFQDLQVSINHLLCLFLRLPVVVKRPLFWCTIVYLYRMGN